MTTEASTYRWNTSAAAEAYDVAAPVIHPYYTAVQDQILDHLPFDSQEPFEVVDLGGGSGRLAERVLERFAGARVTVADQSEPFLALAERRLARFGPRVAIVHSRLQDWPARSCVSPRRDDRVSEKLVHVDAIISTSAIHHLEPSEKRDLYARCYEALAPGGVFINGDEFRPADDAELLKLYKEWSAHMHAAIAEGRIPDSFRTTLEHWQDRNITRFSEPKKSGDDCLETIDAQRGYLRGAGFCNVDNMWAKKLWGVIVAQAPAT
jgi:cyclopropane fatty-acyl-phospholipid synthase-like methyltransferase